MKMLSWHCVATLVAAMNLVRADRRGHLRSGARSDGSRDVWRLDSDLISSNNDNNDQVGRTDGKIALHATLESMVAEMLIGKGPTLNAIVKAGHGKIGLTDAMRQLDGKLPEDVAALVRLTGSNHYKGHANFDEASMQKARRILNGMIYAAWLELDDVVFECKEFQERNRGTYEQVVNDLARLGSQLAKLSENRVSASQGITKADSERKEAEEKLSIRTQEFTAKRFENSREMSVRKNDLAVFDFILMATQCKDSALVQLDSESKSSPKVSICNTQDGLTLNFEDHQLQAKVERLMTPEARLALREALGQAVGPLDLAQIRQAPATVDPNETTTVLPTYAATVVPVKEAPHPAGQWKKCLDGTPNCGLLHDLMSLEWGKFRDGFDELTAEMTKNQQEYDGVKRNINDELTVINDEKTKQMEILANTISSINSDTEELNEKDEQKRALTKEFDQTCAIFRSKIAEILFTKICAVRKVRNELLVNSALTPPSNLSDCDFSDWVSKTGECFAPTGNAILCDDTCPQTDPYKCGGSEMMKRDVVVAPDANGMKCPPLQRSKRCGQKKCPVDCLMSEWSGWSKCTKDCEGGVQAKTRSIITKPKNGGMGCDAVQEDRPCNTGSCDRDCSLLDWTEWEPCSMACGGGVTERVRKVLVPIRGQGRCPTKSSGRRLGQKTCNTQTCIGDETCIAKQDLIVLLDASGSLKEDGFAILRAFTANLTSRYQAKYFGADAMKLGLAVFGNGHLNSLPDGTTTIEAAINVQGLTSDIALVKTQISGVKWQRGFTNMAQGFTLADKMLSQGGRADAQSGVLVLSDGKYSFKYQTAEKARELKDKNVQIFMAPVTDFNGKELEVLKQWASQPWETNYEQIPGLAALKYNGEIFIQTLIAKFCSDAFSPSLMYAKENQKQYILIHEGGWPSDGCGEKMFMGRFGNKDDCAAAVRTQKRLAFAWGQDRSTLGRCYSADIPISQEYWNQFKYERADPPCLNGEWLANPYYDTYIINPRTI